MTTLLIDNYDSFTYNLYQLVGTLEGREPPVRRNDQITLDEIRALTPARIVISPGPGHPAIARDFGVSGAVITELGPAVPILGVCLGHQGIVHHLGGKVVRAAEIVHGKTWPVKVDPSATLFRGLGPELEVMRYHSLVADRASLPADLQITAETRDGLIMGVQHRSWPMFGIQFHPESVGTPAGAEIIARFLAA
jgi:anthranilate synthase component 2